MFQKQAEMFTFPKTPSVLLGWTVAFFFFSFSKDRCCKILSFKAMGRGRDSGFIFSCRLSCAHTERSETMARRGLQNLSSDLRRDPPSLCPRQAAPRRLAAVENPRRCLSTPVGLQTQVFCPTLAEASLNVTGTRPGPRPCSWKLPASQPCSAWREETQDASPSSVTEPVTRSAGRTEKAPGSSQPQSRWFTADTSDG